MLVAPTPAAPSDALTVSALRELPHARHSAGAAFVQGQLYVVGGHEAVLGTNMTDVDSEGKRVGSKTVQRFLQN